MDSLNHTLWRADAFQDQTIVVTGAGSGIGRGTAVLAATLGATVTLLERDRARCDDVRHELEQFSDRVLCLQCDVSDEVQVEDAIEQARARFGQISGLMANAGIGEGGGLLHDMDKRVWDTVLATNLTGVFLTCKYVLRSMVTAQRGGSIVCTSSPAAFEIVSDGGIPAYAASKGGVTALVRAMAVDYAVHGIRVNALVPGPTETAAMWDNVDPADIVVLRKQIADAVPLGRLGDPRDQARAALWLLSPDSSFITGAHVVCDGGAMIKSVVRT